MPLNKAFRHYTPLLLSGALMMLAPMWGCNAFEDLDAVTIEDGSTTGATSNGTTSGECTGPFCESTGPGGDAPECAEICLILSTCDGNFDRTACETNCIANASDIQLECIEAFEKSSPGEDLDCNTLAQVCFSEEMGGQLLLCNGVCEELAGSECQSTGVFVNGFDQNNCFRSCVGYDWAIQDLMCFLPPPSPMTPSCGMQLISCGSIVDWAYYSTASPDCQAACQGVTNICEFFDEIDGEAAKLASCVDLCEGIDISCINRAISSGNFCDEAVECFSQECFDDFDCPEGLECGDDGFCEF